MWFLSEPFYLWGGALYDAYPRLPHLFSMTRRIVMTTSNKTAAAAKLDAQLIAERKEQSESERRIAEAAEKRARKAARKPQPKKVEKRRKTHFATLFQLKACQTLIHGSEKAAKAMAGFIAERAESLKADVVVVPAQVTESSTAAKALFEAGIYPPSMKDKFPQWSADPNFEAEEPEKKVSKSNRGNNGGGRKSGYVQPGTGKSANPYKGMTTAQAKEAAAKRK
jgi:rhodanese-related sulfurtransferase